MPTLVTLPAALLLLFVYPLLFFLQIVIDLRDTPVTEHRIPQPAFPDLNVWCVPTYDDVIDDKVCGKVRKPCVLFEDVHVVAKVTQVLVTNLVHDRRTEQWLIASLKILLTIDHVNAIGVGSGYLLVHSRLTHHDDA